MIRTISLSLERTRLIETKVYAAFCSIPSTIPIDGEFKKKRNLAHGRKYKNFSEHLNFSWYIRWLLLVVTEIHNDVWTTDLEEAFEFRPVGLEAFRPSDRAFLLDVFVAALEQFVVAEPDLPIRVREEVGTDGYWNEIRVRFQFSKLSQIFEFFQLTTYHQYFIYLVNSGA